MGELFWAILASLIVVGGVTLFWVIVFWWLDRYEKEPLWLLGVSFLWGAIPAALLAIVAQLILDYPVTEFLEPGLLPNLISYSLTAPLTEEVIKGAVLLLMVWLNAREIDGVLDGILYGAVIGLGFSFTENLLYLGAALAEGGWAQWTTTAFLRLGLYSLNHALFTGCVGAGFGLARQVPRRSWLRWAAPLVGILLGMGFHALHNAGAVLAENTYALSCFGATLLDWMGVGGLFVLLFYAAYRERGWLEELQAEVAEGMLSPEELDVIRSASQRWQVRWQVLRTQGVRAWLVVGRYFQLLTELAYARHRQRVFGGSAARVEALRERVAEVRQSLVQELREEDRAQS